MNLKTKINKPSSNFTGASALFGAAITYASFSILIRVMAEMFGDNSQVLFRFAVAFIILGFYGVLFKKTAKLSPAAIKKAAWLGIAFSSVLMLFTLSVNSTKIANSIFLLYAGSIISSLLIGTIILKEKLTAAKIVAIMLSLVGLLMYSNALFIPVSENPGL